MNMAFSPDGRTLVTADDGGVVIEWDVASGEIRERLAAHEDGDFTALAIGPDGRTLYTASTDARMAMWDLGGERRLDRHFAAGPPMTFDEGSPKGIAISPNGRTLAVTQMDGRVWLVDTRTLRVVRRARVLDGAALAADFSPDGRTLAVSGEGGAVMLVDAATLKRRRVLEGLDRSGFSQAVAFSPDGRLLAAGVFVGGTPDGSGFVRMWDARSARLTRLRMRIPAVSLAFSPDGRLLAGGGLAEKTEVRDTRSGRRVARIDAGDQVRSVEFSPDGKQLAIGHYGGSVRLVSARDWKPIGQKLDGHRARVTALDFTPDGRLLATGSADGTVRFWDAATQRPIGSALALAPDAYVAARFSRDGAYLFAVPSMDRAVRFDMHPESWKRHACLVAGRELTAGEWRAALPDRPFRSVCGRTG
jgi:WD40 repeat protein